MSADILGAVIEVVSGKRFGEFLKERIFEPLGMVDTGFFVPPEKQSRLAQTYEQQKDGLHLYTGCHLGISSRMEREPAYEAGGAGLVTTVDDWLKFCRMLLNKGTLDGVRILTEPMVDFLAEGVITEEQRKGMRGWGRAGRLFLRKPDAEADGAGACGNPWKLWRVRLGRLARSLYVGSSREGSHHSCDGTADRRRDFHLYAANPQYRVFRDLISVKWGRVYEETDPSDFCGGCSGRRKKFYAKEIVKAFNASQVEYPG